MLHQTTEYQLALARVKDQNSNSIVPTVYAESIDEKHLIQALSIDGAIKLAAQVSQQFGVTIAQFGACGGCYTVSEQDAWAKESARELF